MQLLFLGSLKFKINYRVKAKNIANAKRLWQCKR
jgi:hypothetical protein